MSRPKSRAILLVAACTLWAAPYAAAGAITFHFAATVDFVQGPLQDELLLPGVTAGDLLGTTFHGSYTFDPDAPDANVNAGVGSYSHSGPPYGMEFHFDHRSFLFGEITISILDDQDPASVTPGLLDDLYAVQSTPNPHPTDDLLSFRGRLDLLATGDDLVGPTVITSDALPLEPPDIAAFDQGRVFVNVLRLEENEEGQIVSLVRAGLGGELKVLRVPEPSALLLIGTGLLALLHARRRRARS